MQAFLYAIFPWLLAVLKKADARRLRCIAAAIFCAQCLFSLVIWKAGLSGNAVFYLTYLCPLFRAGDFAISCCMGCLYRSRKEERTPYGACSLLELAAVLFSGGCFFIAAGQVGVLGATAFRYNVLFTPSAVLLVWLLAIGKGMISRLLSAKPFLWLAGLSPYGFLIHQVLIRYMDLAANKFGLTVHPVVWTLTIFLLTLCLSSFCRRWNAGWGGVMPNLPHSEPLTFFRKRQRFIPITIFLSAFTSFFLSAFIFIFLLISAHCFFACRVCVKCAQTQISRLKNFIFQFSSDFRARCTIG